VLRVPLLSILLGLAALSGCNQPREATVKVFVGATVIAKAGDPPQPYSIVIVDGNQITAVGAQSEVPVPTGSMKINGVGKFLYPAGSQGRIKPGEPADLLLVRVNPNEDPQYMQKLDGRMSGGHWTPVGN